MEGVGVAKIAQIMDLCNFLPDMELKGHRIMISDVNRPALQLSGYFKHFEQSRVQIIGTVEYTYLQQLDEEKREKIYSEFMGYDIPCVIFCRDLRPDDSFLKIAEEKNIPVLGTKRSTSEFMAELIYCLNEQLAPCILFVLHQPDNNSLSHFSWQFWLPDHPEQCKHNIHCRHCPSHRLPYKPDPHLNLHSCHLHF